jgi:hypothetical protein
MPIAPALPHDPAGDARASARLRGIRDSGGSWWRLEFILTDLVEQGFVANLK